MEYPFNNAKLFSFFNNQPTYSAGNPVSPQDRVHLQAVRKFVAWLAVNAPDSHAAIAATKPQLLDAEYVVGSGAINAAYPASSSGLSGLGDFGDDTSAYSDTEGMTTNTSDPAYYNTAAPNTVYTQAISPSTVVNNNTTTSTATSWGSDILSTIKTVLPAVFQAQGQQQLIALNVKRAEQGLPPVDISSVTPGVNVGLSSSTTMLVYTGIAALAFVMLSKKH